MFNDSIIYDVTPIDRGAQYPPENRFCRWQRHNLMEACSGIVGMVDVAYVKTMLRRNVGVNSKTGGLLQPDDLWWVIVGVASRCVV